jgi:coenzyme A diphosphatase NUDT7
VVFLVTDNTINPILNPAEVAHLFSMPLSAFLHHRPSQIPGWQFRSHRIDTSLGKLGPPPQVPYANQPTPASRDDEKEAVDQDEDQDVGGKEGRYYQYRDVSWGEKGQKVRMHRFLTGREGGGVKPVYGLTAYVHSRL